MKVRTGLVSNSSSSSFIVIDYKKIEPPPPIKHLVIDGSGGETEFGWGPDRIYSRESRIIFAWLQADYAGREDWGDQLEEVLKEYFLASTIEWKISKNLDQEDGLAWAYIDHQSNAAEDQNTEMFDSKEDLVHFLFGENSFIVLDNDNH